MSGQEGELSGTSDAIVMKRMITIVKDTCYSDGVTCHGNVRNTGRKGAGEGGVK